MNTHDNPRFEFRIFGHTLTPALEDVVQHAMLQEAEQQTDLYLLAAGKESYNVKIRNNALNTKVLMRQQEGLERWHSHLDITFPLSAAFLREILFPLLGVPAITLPQTLYTVTELQQQILPHFSSVRAIPVHKQRRHYTVDNCRLEVAVLYVDNRFYTDTIAIEAVDADVVQRLRMRLGLQEATNTNYNLGLQQLLSDQSAAAPMAQGKEPDSYTINFAERMGFSTALHKDPAVVTA